MIELPSPRLTSDVPLEHAIYARRSIREFTDEALTLQQISQLLWSAAGITDDENGFRASPSAGGVFPMTIWIMARGTSALAEDKFYVYDPAQHGLTEKRMPKSDRTIGAVCFGQDWMDRAPLTIFVTSTSSKMRKKYGEDIERFLFQEAGHIAQNLLLQAAAIGLAGTPVAAYGDDDVRKFLGTRQDPVYIISMGHPAG